MTYEEAIAWLYGLAPRGIRLGLDRVRRALAMRGDPQRALRFVHVAGTNGKGSTCAMIESAPTPLNPCAVVPPLNSTQTSAAAIPGIPFEFESRTTTLIRALFARLVPPSLFGHALKNDAADVPSIGVPTLPRCGTKNDAVGSGTPA